MAWKGNEGIRNQVKDERPYMESFRISNKSDARKLSVLRQKLWAETYRGIYPDDMIFNYNFASHESKFLSQIESSETEVYIIEINEEPIGYFIFGEPGHQRMKKYGLHLKSLYILSKYQNMGIGSRVFMFLGQYCIVHGIKNFYNSCNSHNTHARDFYMKNGGRMFYENSGHDEKVEDQCYFEYIINHNAGRNFVWLKMFYSIMKLEVC